MIAQSKEVASAGLSSALKAATHLRLSAHRCVVTSLIATILITLYLVRSENLTSGPHATTHGAHYAATEDDYTRAIEAAGNATLGFQEIRLINVPGRYDRRDAAILQGYITGLQIKEEAGVRFADIPKNGLPPTSTPGRVHEGETGAWRAHANIWGDMLRDRTGPILILEADATWDINTRVSSATANREFLKFLNDINSRPLRQTFHPLHPASSTDESAIPETILPDPEDPWLSTHWDVLNLGVCREGGRGEDVYRTWPDGNVKPGFNHGPMRLGAERGVRVSGAPVCTVAYAVSQRGAAKLLMRSALNLDNPVDLLINEMVKGEELLAYTILPDMFAQWVYKEQIGASYRGSDIHPDRVTKRQEGWTVVAGARDGGKQEEDKKEEEQQKKEEEEQKKKEEEEEKKKQKAADAKREKQEKLQKMRDEQTKMSSMSGWFDAMYYKNVWDVRGTYKNRWSRLREPALSSAWRHIFSDEDMGMEKWEEAVKGVAFPELKVEKTEEEMAGGTVVGVAEKQRGKGLGDERFVEPAMLPPSE